MLITPEMVIVELEQPVTEDESVQSTEQEQSVERNVEKDLKENIDILEQDIRKKEKRLQEIEKKRLE